MITPEYLKNGDKVTIVAPAFCMPMDTLISACDILRGWGLVPEYSDLVFSSCQKFLPDLEQYSGTEAERSADLTSALLSDSKAIICARGGYGSAHLTGILERGIFAGHPKWLVGFSDITALHALSLSDGVMSIHGPMCASLNGDLRDILFGKLLECETFKADFCVEGNASGTLVGGNMITLASLSGTRTDMLAHKDIVLFLEEVGESFHAIDRQMRVIAGSPLFKNVKALVFGEFTDCVRDLPYASVEDMLYEYVRNLGIPVAFGFPAGHGSVNVPFIEGSEVQLSVDSIGNFELRYI